MIDVIQDAISSFEKIKIEWLVAEKVASFSYYREVWLASQPKDRVFKFGGLSANPSESTMQLVEKTIDQMDDEEIRIQMILDISQNYNFQNVIQPKK